MKIKNDFELLPFYKERKMDGKSGVCSVRLPMEAKKELDSILESKYGSTSEGLKYILMNYLNTSCLERKYFQFKMVFITKKKTGHFMFDDLIPIGYFDYYSLINQLEHEGDLIKHDEKEGYLEYDSLDSFQSFVDSWMSIGGSWVDFTRWNHYQIGDYIVHLQKLFGNLDEYMILPISLNNFLDKKINGRYMDSVHGKELFHYGLGFFFDENKDVHFYSYHWEIHPSQNEGKWMIGLRSINTHQKDGWIDLILNSTNNDLKRFLDESDFKIEEYDKEKAMKHIEYLQSELDRIREALKEGEKKMKPIIERQNELERTLEELGILASKITFEDDDVELEPKDLGLTDEEIKDLNLKDD